MKKLIATALAAVVGASLAVTASASEQPGPQAAAAKPPRQTICHRTGSAKNPYRRITTSSRAVVRGHSRHPGDIVMPGTAPCPSAVLPGNRGTVLRARLAPVGNATGSGFAFIRVRGNQVCFVLKLRNTTVPLTAAHIHQTSTGGNIVVPLSVPTNPNAASTGCVTVTPTLAQAILANAGDFYVNVHTTSGTVILSGPLTR